MSGRGRGNCGGGGGYCGGRGSRRGPGRFNCRSGSQGPSDEPSNNEDSDEMKFAPHYPGEPQKVTCDTLKDHIVMQVQKTFKNRQDMADALRTETDIPP